jgi:hypothetical protein
MKTVVLDGMTYRVRESHDLSDRELSEIDNLLGRISTARGKGIEKSITAFLKILLPDLTEAELSSDDKTSAVLFQKTHQQFLQKLC